MWNATLEEFEEVYAESYCYTNYQYQKECDVHLDLELAPLSLTFI